MGRQWERWAANKAAVRCSKAKDQRHKDEIPWSHFRVTWLLSGEPDNKGVCPWKFIGVVVIGVLILNDQCDETAYLSSIILRQ